MGSILAIPAVIAAAVTTLSNEGPFHLLYYSISYLYLCVVRRLHRRRLDVYDFKVDGQPEKNGLFVPQEEYDLDTPQKNAELQKTSDDVFFYGINSKSESLAIHISRRPHGYVCSSLHLRLSDGKTYGLPDEHQFQKETSETNAFGSARFSAQCLSPFRKWRIFFNGILREVSTEEKGPSSTLKHVAFTFLWKASSEVFDYNDDIPAKVLAKAAASPTSIFSFPVFNLQKIQNVLDSYEQPGMICGTLKCDGTEQEIYLWGVRGRYRGCKKVVADSNIQQIYGTLKTGAIIHLETRHLPGISPKLTFGYVQKSNGFIHPIKECSETITERNMRFSFDCDGERYLFDVIRKPLVKKKFEKEVSGNIYLEQNTMVMNGIEGKGLVFSGVVAETSSKIERLKERNSFVQKCGHLEDDLLLSVPFQDPCCQNPELTGGKGSSLGKLHALSKDIHLKDSHFEVPLGVVVTTESYKIFIKGDLENAMKKFEKSIWGDKNVDISTLCIALSDKVRKTSLPESVVNSVIKDLEMTFGSDWTEIRFAVRSSATGEDTTQMSAAGQMETYLGVKGKEQVLDAVRKCWASQFFLHPVQYKRRYGQLLNMPMAVVVQQMVSCDVAGVLFTCDPVTGNPEFISISANWGLGESVVSASADPDTIVIKRDIKDRLSFHSEMIGQKKSKIVMDGISGTKEIEFETPASDCCLKKNAALKLAEIAVRVEDEFGDPRDIEWGIANDTIFLFQSRPVTSIDTDTEFEAKHFFDSHIRAEEEYVTTANVAEVLPGSMAPVSIELSQSSFFVLARRARGDIWSKNTGPEVPYFHKILNFTYNHAFITLVDGIMHFYDENSLSSKAMVVSLFGRMIEERHKISIIAVERHGSTKPSLFEKISFAIQMAMVMFGANYWIKIGAKDVKTKKIHYKNESTAAGVLRALGNGFGIYWRGFQCTYYGTTSSSTWNMLLLTLLVKAKGAFDNEVYSDFAYLLSTCTQLESADIPSAIQNLGCAIARCIEPKKFQEMDTEEAIKWLQSSKTEAGLKFRQFLERHGHRCPREFDQYIVPWGWDQRPLVETLKIFMSSSLQTHEVKKEIPFSEVISNLHVKLDFMSRLKLRLLLPNCRRAVREREAGKSVIIAAVHQQRKPMHKLADLMVEEGRLPHRDLMFFLGLEEIVQLMKTRSPRIVARAHKRFGYHSEMDKLMFPEIICGVPRPTNIYEDYGEAVEGTVMTGIPVSQGVVKATARVVPTLAEANSIKPGDVLIAYSTDIGWSPYFPLLSGVVTELGGLVSHGAVVAREYGLPCVVGLQGATKIFKSGDIVVLDGTKGTIKKIGSE